MLENTEIQKLHLFDYGVFPKASVDTLVLVFKRVMRPNPSHKVEIERASSISEITSAGQIEQKEWTKHPTYEFDLILQKVERRLLEKIEKISFPLGEIATAYFGIQTHDRSKYVIDHPIDSMWKPVLDGGNIHRYRLDSPNEYVYTKPDAIHSGGESLVYEQERIGVRQIGRRPIATILPGGWYALNTIYNIYFTEETEYQLEYILGLLLSNLIGWYWEQVNFDQKKTFPKIKKAPLLAIPIATIDSSTKEDRDVHDHLVRQVKQILGLYRQLKTVKTDQENIALMRKVNNADRKIDQLVYELYGLTEKEIKIVEEAITSNA